MVADRFRSGAYVEALRKTVRQGSVVVEIGTGPGVFAVLSCQLGARQVYAIEMGGIIQVAREIAAANGCADKVEFIEGYSERVTLPERADVVVSDLRGVLPLFERHIPAIADARHRFLAPNGILVPQKDILWAAIVEAPESYKELVDPWENNALGQDLSVARQMIVNTTHKIRVNPDQLLTAEQLWTTLDYRTVKDPDVRGHLHWRVERAGTGHGILVWFDANLAEGAGFSTGPSAPETIYGSLFLPWTRPVSLAPHQEVAVRLEAKLVENDYVWRWTTQIKPSGVSDTAHIEFAQSQLSGDVLSTVQLHKTAADYTPHLSEEGRLHRRAFELVDGTISLEEIAHRLATEFPQRFPKWEQALSYVGAISREFSR